MRSGVSAKSSTSGSNFEISIGDTARTIAEVMQAEIEILTDDQRLRPENSEVMRLWAVQ